MSDNFKFIPSVLLSEVYFPWMSQPGFILNKMERIVEANFYKAFEVGTDFTKAERKHLHVLVSSNQLFLTQWLTHMLNERNLTLSTLDLALRKRSVQAVLAQIPIAAESGVTTLAFISGDDPGESLREAALDAFSESLDLICEAAKHYNIAVIIEPLDRFAHKKKLVGPTSTTVQLLSSLRLVHQNIGFAFDTAHTRLNDESVLQALSLAKDQIAQIHLSNAILDKTDPLYGDYHIAPGLPGFLTVESAVSILQEAKKQHISGASGLKVAIESRALIEQGDDVMYQIATQFLQTVLSQIK